MSKKSDIKDSLEIYNLIRKFKTRRVLFLTWKEHLSERGLFFSRIGKITAETIEFLPTNSEGYNFKEGDSLILWNRDQNLAMKAKGRIYNSDKIIFSFPKILHHLNEDEIKSIKIIYTEGDEINFDEESERRKEKRGKSARSLKVQVSKRFFYSGAKSKIENFILHDLSPSGIGFITEDPGNFKKGSEVEIISIENKRIEGLLVGVVVSIRELIMGKFKIGIHFSYREKNRS